MQKLLLIDKQKKYIILNMKQDIKINDNQKFELGDLIEFDYKILDPEFEEQTNHNHIILGENTFLPNFDFLLINKDIVEQIEIDYWLSKRMKINHSKKSRIIKIQLSNINLKSSDDKKANILKKTFESFSNADLVLQNEQQIKNLQNQISNLEIQNNSLKLENANNIESLNKKAKELAEKAKQEIEELKQKTKDHLENEFKEKIQYNMQSFFEDILNPLNNIQIAINSGSNSDNTTIKNYVLGFQMLLDQAFKVMEDFGLSIISPTIGDEFNPEWHHAFEIIDNPNYSKNQIIEIKSKGYRLHNRVIKPAIVIVAK